MRATGAVILGYLVMVLVVFATLTAAYLGMGVDRAFQPKSYEVSGLWVAVSFALGFVAAVVGGYVCAAIARKGRAPDVLAGLVVVFGLLAAIPVVMGVNDRRPTERAGDVNNLAAMQSARQPVWVAMMNPFVGAVGVLVGTWLKWRGDGTEVSPSSMPPA
jgi:hypothetical protein